MWLDTECDAWKNSWVLVVKSRLLPPKVADWPRHEFHNPDCPALGLAAGQ